METQPMTSAKIVTGEYAVLGTSTECIVRQGRSRSSWGTRGWDLYSDGQHVRWFLTKRDALVYCQEHPEL